MACCLPDGATAVALATTLRSMLSALGTASVESASIVSLPRSVFAVTFTSTDDALAYVVFASTVSGVSFADERFELAGFIRNAFDEDYLLDAGNTGGSFTVPTFIPAEPRLFGVELTARFGN